MIKKKGRKPKSYYENLKNDTSNNLINDVSNVNINDISNVKIPKKRGRKPKGGKIVEIKDILVTNIPKPNVILHLKCFLNDIDKNNFIKYTPNIDNIDNYNLHESNLNFNFIKNENDISSNNDINNNDNDNDNDNKKKINDKLSDEHSSRKNIDKKIKELSYSFKIDNVKNKSACFWCTYSFDNEAIYIPINYNNNTYNCYGCFCSPECACSYLMNENIDSSTKFERYYLLNLVYGKIYNYTKNIKPAPSPYYLLKKYNGNLDIQEYRKLLEYERLLLIIDKPLTKQLPEIYEENDDYLVNPKILSKQKS